MRRGLHSLAASQLRLRPFRLRRLGGLALAGAHSISGYASLYVHPNSAGICHSLSNSQYLSLPDRRLQPTSQLGKEAELRLVAPQHDPIILKLADLKAMPHLTITIHNSPSNADESYSGVRLSDLMAKLGAPLGGSLRGKALAHYIVANGSDGYQTVLAIAEVDPEFHPGEVLVADAMDGKALDAHSGPLKLVVTEDKLPARSVRNLVPIELKAAP